MISIDLCLYSLFFLNRSHYDCIRSLRFHSTEPLLITASDDETLKLWNINKTQSTKSMMMQSFLLLFDGLVVIVMMLF